LNPVRIKPSFLMSEHENLQEKARRCAEAKNHKLLPSLRLRAGAVAAVLPALGRST
jgi:hypothetical protein